MQYGIVIQPVATIYEIPAETMVKDGMTLSAIADEAMYGTGLAITGEEVTGDFSELQITLLHLVL